jgi:hypothetical protein
MVDGFRVHRADHTPLVGFRSDVRDEFAEPVTRLTVLLELEHRRGDREVLLAGRHGRQTLALADGLW